MKICIAHFRVGLTDGVSLQINERARILERFGHKVNYIADLDSPIADLRIPYLAYKKNLKIIEIQSAAFGGKINKRIISLINKISLEIENDIDEYWKSTNFSLIFIHNFFSLPVCLPGTIAFYNFLKKHPQVKAVGVHHDFWSDPPRVELFKSKSKYVNNLIRKYFPPVLPNLSHTVLSKWEHEKLMSEKRIKSEIITDTFDFEQKKWLKDDTNTNYLKDSGINETDIKILLASRIRTRKGIEIGIDFAAALQNKVNKKVVLILPNDFSVKEADYIKLLKEKAEALFVNIIWNQHLVGSEEEKLSGLKKYSLWDTYVYCDAVIYPSLWEGFGNQFLEAVFANKPIVSYEYPVFDTDIKPAGFDVISVGRVSKKIANGLIEVDKSKIDNAANELLALLNDKKRLKSISLKNFKIGKNKFNTRLQLRKYLSISSLKYTRTNGYKTVISPLILAGKFAACGVRIGEAYDLAETIIADVPDFGITNDDFFVHIVNKLPQNIKERFVTLEVAKQYLTSKNCKSPLFIFLGGLAGKTTLANMIVSNLGINQAVAFDNEKYHIADPKTSESYLWKATYESPEGYVKTVETMYPYLLKMIDRNLFDFNRYKKWCYLWEGIYLSSEIVKRLKTTHEGIEFLSIFILPKFEDIRKQYLLRWQDELGIEKLKERKNVIDGYLNNVSVIRSRISKNLDPIASFVIESPIMEERLSAFYAILHQRLKDIAERNVPGWISKICEKPHKIRNYKKLLNGN
jgi:mannosylglucosylglycerate synthase